jgi:hypothetical protein
MKIGLKQNNLRLRTLWTPNEVAQEMNLLEIEYYSKLRMAMIIVRLIQRRGLAKFHQYETCKLQQGLG